MPGRRTGRDRRRSQRHAAGQRFLVDRAVVGRLVRGADVARDELIVDVGAGAGALTLPLAEAGARVLAVEVDPAWVRRLRGRVVQAGLQDRVRVVHADLRAFKPPREPWRVVANPPFALTTALLRRLLDDPSRGPRRADLVLQLAVARKRSHQPPSTLHSAAWAPWWTFELGARIDRSAFRPAPDVDAAVLTIRRRDPELLPTWLAPGFAEVLRPAWSPPPERNPR